MKGGMITNKGYIELAIHVVYHLMGECLDKRVIDICETPNQRVAQLEQVSLAEQQKEPL